MNSARPKVRFPPSPSGYCHVGTARMAIINYLFAKKHGGSIVFRSEDTDRERSRQEFEDDIIASLQWLGISWDSFARQSERIPLYRKKLEQLLSADKAYISEEESKREAGKMTQVVRLRNPGSNITFTDIIHGDITFDTTELGDFAIARGINDPIYHFAVVVDDADMGITHVIRGEDHISNTPRQILIQEALGLPRPQYAHYPLHLSKDRSKLSKRKGDVAVRSYRAKGFLPEALFNYLAVLGWTPPSGREVMTKEEMIAEFELTDLHKSGAVFDLDKLRWFNRRYMETMSEAKTREYLMPPLVHALEQGQLPVDETVAARILPLIRERVHVSDDVGTLIEAGEFDFFFTDPSLDLSRLPEKKSNADEAATHLETILPLLEAINDWNEAAIRDALWEYASSAGRAAVLWPFRYSLSGREKSPDPFVVASILGKGLTVRRIKEALRLLAAV